MNRTSAPPSSTPAAGVPQPSSPLLIAVAWLVVALPACWGIYQTGVTSLALFRNQATASPAKTIAPAPYPATTSP